jgi:DNA-binding beta-propeller fold protein YncE
MAAAFAAAAILVGCSGSSQGPSSTLPGAGSGPYSSRSYSDLARTGVSPKYFALLRLGLSPTPDRKRHRRKYKGKRDLYVSDFGTGGVVVLKNKTYTEVGTITDGVDGPDGNTIDAKGNFYEANYEGDSINEYAPGGSSPSMTYNASMLDPIGVGVDKKGNVYETDYDDGEGSGFVNEYAQGSNTVTATCSPGGSVEGVAVDKSGDVFVYYNTTSGTAKITEYKGGLSSCSGTVLTPTFEFAGGMAIDKEGDLIVCDQTGNEVEVIDPPYSSVTRVLESGDLPFHVAINEDNKLVFVASDGDADVQVIDYATGTVVDTLSGGSQGLSDPAAAVDGPNAVY